MTEIREQTTIPLWNIKPSRWQPREAEFDATELYELAQSIRDNGLINPVLVFADDDEDGYVVWELIAGERRTRATAALKLAELFPNHTLEDWCGRLAHVGLHGMGVEEHTALRGAPTAKISATVHEERDMQRIHVMAVIENIDRASLTPIEEGRAYQSLMQAYGWSQREVAGHVNKSQGYVAQRIGILALPKATQEAVNTRVIGLTEARALAAMPENMQAAATAWVVEVAKSNDEPVAARELEARLRQVAVFLDPDRWLPNGEHVYSPMERNRLRAIRETLLAGVPPDRIDNILALQKGIAGRNLLKLAPLGVVDAWLDTAQVIRAITGEDLREHELLAKWGMSCLDCRWNDVKLSTHSRIVPACEKHQAGGLRPCYNYIGWDDPVVIPLGWDLQRVVDGVQAEPNPFPHVTSIADYVRLYDAAAQARRTEEQKDQKRDMSKATAAVLEYYEYQQSLPEEWRAHFQAHACEKCAHCAPPSARLNPPCYRLSVAPFRDVAGNPRAPEFGLLVTQSGQIAPRCEGFAYCYQPDIYLAGKPERILPERSRVLTWIEALSEKARTTYRSNQMWAPFGWLARVQRQPDEKQPFSLDRFKRWLVENWDRLGDAAVAHLIDVLLSETELMTRTEGAAVDLLDATGLQRTTWRRLNYFPLSIYREREYYQPRNWPNDWVKPWEIKEIGESVLHCEHKDGGDL